MLMVLHSWCKQNIKVAIIGGSFNENLITLFLKNKTFSKIDFYFYFNEERLYSGYNNKPTISTVDPTSMATSKTIQSAAIIILAENASLTISEHGKKFYDTLQKT